MLLDPGKRPRVALVVHDIAAFGGMDRALKELIERTRDRFEFVVFSRALTGELRDLAEWRRVPVPPRPIPLKFAAYFLLAGMRLARARVDLVCSVGAVVPNRIDVAWVHHSHTAFHRATGGLAPSGLPLSRRVNTSLLRAESILAERWSYGRDPSPALSAVSKGLADELAQDFPGCSVYVIPNGVDTTRFQPDRRVRREVRAELGLDDEVVALFVGGDWGHKGLGMAIEALVQARRSGVDLQLWVVGRGDEKRYSTLARSLGVGDSVRFLGPRVDTKRFYQASDLFVLPSAYEALPLVALEALAASLPLVATQVNGVTELFGESAPGILVERSRDSIAGALVQLGADAGLRRRLGETGRLIAGEYTWERSVEATVELFNRLLAAKRSRPADSRLVGAPS